jgi:hypothetical protein
MGIAHLNHLANAVGLGRAIGLHKNTMNIWLSPTGTQLGAFDSIINPSFSNSIWCLLYLWDYFTAPLSNINPLIVNPVECFNFFGWIDSPDIKLSLPTSPNCSSLEIFRYFIPIIAAGNNAMVEKDMSPTIRLSELEKLDNWIRALPFYHELVNGYPFRHSFPIKDIFECYIYARFRILAPVVLKFIAKGQRNNLFYSMMREMIMTVVKIAQNFLEWTDNWASEPLLMFEKIFYYTTLFLVLIGKEENLIIQPVIDQLLEARRMILQGRGPKIPHVIFTPETATSGLQSLFPEKRKR